MRWADRVEAQLGEDRRTAAADRELGAVLLLKAV